MTHLPRPVRFAADPDGARLRSLISAEVKAELAKPYTDGLLVQMLMARVPLLKRLFAIGAEYGTAPQVLSLLATELAFQHAGGVVVELTPTLIELLLNTDLEATEHLTAEDLRLPFDTPIFLRAPSSASELQVTGHDQPLPLDGFYLRRTHVELDGVSVDGMQPGIYDGIDIVCLSQPTSERDPLDDAYFHLPLAWLVSEEQTTVEEILRRRHRQMAAGNPDLHQHFAHLIDGFRPLLEFVLKALIYLNLPEARRRAINEASELAKRMRGLGPKKQARLARQHARAYDRIEVGPTHEEAAAMQAGEGGRTVAAHYRRGHFRRQRFGEGRTQTRRVWIKPVLVAFAGGLGPRPAPKDYRVST